MINRIASLKKGGQPAGVHAASTCITSASGGHFLFVNQQTGLAD